ncbi:MAG TPA: adenylate/guanylate cyclase domain-containing protein, partial [Pyrinomonadaceae bacterium]
NRALDLLFQLRDAMHPETRRRAPSEPITIIKIDEASIRQSNVRLQRWPREYYARLIDRAREGGARVIGLDLYLSEEGGVSAEDKAADQRLIDSLSQTDKIVIVEKTQGGGTDAIKPLEMFAEYAYVGFADLPHDSDNAVRSSLLSWVAPDGEVHFSFGSTLAQLYTGEELKAESPTTMRLGNRVLPLRPDAGIQIDFRGRTPAFQSISAGEILFKEGAAIPDELFRDRIVIIGAYNNDAPDLFLTPYYESMALPRAFDKNLPITPAQMPGAEIHANAAATILFGNSLVRPAIWKSMLMLLVPLGLVGVAVFRLRSLPAFLVVVLVAAASLAVAAWAFSSHSTVLPLATAWIGVGLLAPLGFVLRYAHERAERDAKEAERAQIMDIFSRCVSPEVAEELYSKGEVVLGGELRVVTLIFTDIRGFTTLTEAATSSEQVVEWLNEYFSRMHKVISFYGGHINKYIGDGLMIVFGAPVNRGEKLEARAAVACGLGMLEEIERINEDWKDMGRPHIAIGVGIHTGEATCGVVGAPGRLEYTLIGDTVNLAARLESTTKDAGVPMLVSSTTAAQLGESYETSPLGNVTVKGKTESTSVYTVKKKSAPAPAPAAVTA